MITQYRIAKLLLVVVRSGFMTATLKNVRELMLRVVSS